LLSGGKPLGQYQLIAHLKALDQPLIGASLTVTSTVQYTLVERSSGKDVLSRSIVAPYTAAWNSALWALSGSSWPTKARYARASGN
jgi:hypothetical protein